MSKTSGRSRVGHFGVSISYFVTDREMLTSDFRELASLGCIPGCADRELACRDDDMTVPQFGKPGLAGWAEILR
jgi:hypothetical protein